MEQHSVRISDDSLTFSSAHFITYDNGECETIHGHDFCVSVDVAQPLSPAGGYVLDFLKMQKTIRGILQKLDHKTLLAAENPYYTVGVHEAENLDFDPMQDYLSRVRDPESSRAVLEKMGDSGYDWEQHLSRELGMTPIPEQGFSADVPTMAPIEVEVEVRYRHRRWILPQTDCEILPITNTSAEILAEYIARQLMKSPLLSDGKWLKIRVELREARGMAGIFEIVK